LPDGAGQIVEGLTDINSAAGHDEVHRGTAGSASVASPRGSPRRLVKIATGGVRPVCWCWGARAAPSGRTLAIPARTEQLVGEGAQVDRSHERVPVVHGSCRLGGGRSSIHASVGVTVTALGLLLTPGHAWQFVDESVAL
jgi:hypothetical protein